MHVLIAGAGIGGLCLARGLRAAAIAPTDAAAALAPSLTLTPVPDYLMCTAVGGSGPPRRSPAGQPDGSRCSATRST
jgi:hypothetical protein